MGIVNIEDELHEQLRRASKASCRSINAQAAFWIRPTSAASCRFWAASLSSWTSTRWTRPRASRIYNIYETYMRSRPMGIVNIEDELHEQLRRASKASCRSINAQAAFWIRIGMLGELNPGLTFQELAARELKAAGVGADLTGSGLTAAA